MHAVGREAYNHAFLDFCRLRRQPLQVDLVKVASFRDAKHWSQESQRRKSEKNREGYEVPREPSLSVPDRSGLLWLLVDEV